MYSSITQALTDLLAKAEADQEGLAAARYLSEAERQNRVEEIANERKAWRMDAVRDAMQAVPDDLQTEVCNFTYYMYPSPSLPSQNLSSFSCFFHASFRFLSFAEGSVARWLRHWICKLIVPC